MPLKKVKPLGPYQNIKKRGYMMKLNNTFFSSIQWKLLVAIFCMTLVPSIVTGILSFNKANVILENDAYVQRQMEVGKAADRLEQYLTDNQVAITALSKNAAAKNMASLEQQALMKAFQEGLGSFELLFVVDANGIIKNTFPYTNFGGKVDFTDRQWYKDVAREKKTVISDTYVSAFTKQATAPIIAPVYDDNGTILGYIGGNLSLSNLSSLVGPLSSGNTGKGIILDKNNFYLIDSRDEVKGKSHEDFKEEKIKNMISGGKAQWNQFGDDLVVYTPVGTTGWSILSMQPSYEFMGKTRELRDTIILVIGVAILFTTMIIGAIGFIALRKTIIDPVARLSVAAGEIAKGDFRQHHISYAGNDEIGFLAKSLGRWLKALVRLYAR